LHDRLKVQRATTINSIKPVKPSFISLAGLLMLPSKTADMRLTRRSGFHSSFRAAEDRIAELEAEVAAYRQQAERAEQWLHKVYTEIEHRFLNQAERVRRGARATIEATGNSFVAARNA
jgi:hypothetical protein